MEYRELGKTGMRASIVGLGAEHLLDKPYSLTEEVIGAALDGGINIIDVFMPQTQVRQDIAKALGSRRKDVLLQGHIGSTVKDNQAFRTRDLDECKRYFDEFIELFGYADLGMMFFIDTDTDYRDSFETHYIDYVLELRKQGLIRAVGASSHDAVRAARMVETGLLDVLMFSVNPAYDMLPGAIPLDDVFTEMVAGSRAFQGMDPARAHLYELCAQKGVGITCMKTLAAGWLLSAENTPFAGPMTVGQCMHYALTRPAVASVLVGCANGEQVREALRYLELSDAEKDYSIIAQNVQGDLRGKCMYCNHCLPCPSGIDIAALTKLLDLARLSQDVPDTVQAHYRSLEAHASDCIECGSCESNCPFGVPVIENMREAVRRFGW